MGLQFNGYLFLLFCGFLKLTLWLEDTDFDLHGAMLLQLECINVFYWMQFSCYFFVSHVSLFPTCEGGQVYVELDLNTAVVKIKEAIKSQTQISVLKMIQMSFQYVKCVANAEAFICQQMELKC